MQKNKRIVKIIIGIIVAFNFNYSDCRSNCGIIGDNLETGETTSFDDSGNTDLTSI